MLNLVGEDMYVGERQEELLARKRRLVARGISNATSVFAQKAQGAMIIDVEGREFLDFYGGIGSVSAGHCPPPVVEAVKEQVGKFIHTCFMVTMYESYLDLAERLITLTPGDFEKRALFVNSGAEAVENAVKIARAHTQRPSILSLECGFHGRTLLAMSLTSKVCPYKFGFGPFAPEVYKIPSAYCYRCYYRSSYPECGLHCLEQFERTFAADVPPEKLAAIIVEPVQGEGGFIVPPPEFLPGIQEICAEYGIVFIADEVQTCLGRTGRMFACEHWGVTPELITVAKSIASGLPLAGVVGHAEIMDAPGPGQLGGTFGGNPVASAAALATIDYMEQEQLVERATAIGERTRVRMREMRDKYPLVGDVRGLGAMNAMELVIDRNTKEPAKDKAAAVCRYCVENGVLIISAGLYGNVVRTLVPLVITDAELERGLDVLDAALASVQ